MPSMAERILVSAWSGGLTSSRASQPLAVIQVRCPQDMRRAEKEALNG
jgi:hypothetical protein